MMIKVILSLIFFLCWSALGQQFRFLTGHTIKNNNNIEMCQKIDLDFSFPTSMLLLLLLKFTAITELYDRNSYTLKVMAYNAKYYWFVYNLKTHKYLCMEIKEKKKKKKINECKEYNNASLALVGQVTVQTANVLFLDFTSLVSWHFPLS